MTIQLKTCACCKQALDVSSFGKHSYKADGLNIYCRLCHCARVKARREANPDKKRASDRAYQKTNPEKNRASSKLWREKYPERRRMKRAKERAIKLLRAPLYASSPEHQALIKRVYAEARLRGWHVDHVIPLQGELASGLHCWANLQVLAPVENLSKSNKFEPGDI